MRFINLIITYSLSLIQPCFAFSERDLIQILQQPQTVQGNFTQTRQLRALSNQIRMQGEFVLVNQKELLWQLKQPFPIDLRVSTQGVSQWNGTEWTQSGNLGQGEQIKLFLGLLSGNIEAFKSQFKISLTGDKQHWELSLVPNTTLMQQIFKGITIKGDNSVKQILLEEQQGDNTTIEFKQIKFNQPLSAFAKSALN